MKQELKDAFKVFDKNDDKVIDFNEMKQVHNFYFFTKFELF